MVDDLNVVVIFGLLEFAFALVVLVWGRGWQPPPRLGLGILDKDDELLGCRQGAHHEHVASLVPARVGVGGGRVRGQPEGPDLDRAAPGADAVEVGGDGPSEQLKAGLGVDGRPPRQRSGRGGRHGAEGRGEG